MHKFSSKKQGKYLLGVVVLKNSKGCASALKIFNQRQVLYSANWMDFSFKTTKNANITPEGMLRF